MSQDDDTKTARFVRWLQEHGAKIDALAISTDEWGSRGVVATRSIGANEICMEIPAKLFISEASVKEDVVLSSVFEEHKDLFSRDDPLLSTYVAYHINLKDESFYEPYLSILPEPESILNWTRDELNELQDMRLAEVAERRNQEIQDWYDRISARLFRLYPDLFHSDSFPLTTFRFAWQTIQARTFGRRLPWTSLVPFADCLNHANLATRYDYNVEGNEVFRWQSSQSHIPGQQVFNSYGRRSNQQLLLDYGFALHANEWDYVDLDMQGLNFKLPKIDQRRLFLDAHLMPFPSRIRLSPDSTLDEILPYFRCASLTEYVAGATSLLVPQQFEVEVDALKRLDNAISSYINQYPTTMEEDAYLLEEISTLSVNKRIAIEYRWHRKHILHRIQNLAQAQLNTMIENRANLIT